MEPEELGLENEPEGGDDNPWAAYEAAGIDPSALDPEEIQKAVNLRNALTDRDIRRGALSKLIADDVDGMSYDEVVQSVQELRQMREAEGQEDPWDILSEDEDDAMDMQATPFTLDQVRDAVRAETEAARAQWEQDQMQREAERASLQEFESRIDKIAEENELSDRRKSILASQAIAMASQVGGEVSPSGIVDDAWKTLADEFVVAEAESLDKQPKSEPGGTPPSEMPADGVEGNPMTLDEAKAELRNLINE